jgi:hypothetical protein
VHTIFFKTEADIVFGAKIIHTVYTPSSRDLVVIIVHLI